MTEADGAAVMRLKFMRSVLLNESTREEVMGKKGQIRYNLMTEEVELEGSRVSLENADLFPIRIAVGEVSKRLFGKTIEPSNENLAAVLTYVAQLDAYHPVEEFITGLIWDGEDRLSGGLPAAFGQVPGSLQAVMLRLFLRSLTARAIKPGCKVDTVLVLVGAQGKYKSTALRVLADPWFTDQHVDVENKDSWDICHRHALIEFSELSAMRKADLEQVKAFVAKTEDTFRSPYGRKAITRLRRFVIAGSTNNNEFLQDPTGNRRFWPVDIGETKIDVEWLKANRDQLLAQAATEMRAGEPWWLVGEQEAEHAVLAKSHTEDDAWTEEVENWLHSNLDKGREGMSSPAILQAVFKSDHTGNFHTGHMKRVKAILERLGARQKKTNSVRIWRW